MKSRSTPSLRLAAALALTFAAYSHAADFTWDGGTGVWSATNWNVAAASGPITAGNTATINSGIVTVDLSGPGNVDSITVGSEGQLNLNNAGGATNPNGVYSGLSNLILQGGIVNAGPNTYNAYGASFLGNLTVSGSNASTITGSSWFNLGSSTTFTVADVTSSSASDLLVNLSLRSLPGSPDYTYLYNSKIIKEGAGTMEVTVHSYFNGGLDLNGGTLKLSGGNGGYGFFASSVTVNSGTTLTIDSDGTGFGYQNGWKPSSVNIIGGTVNGGGNHVWGISGGVNMTGGTLQTAGSIQWNYTNLNTSASADTATVAGPLSLRGDGGYTTMLVNVADGGAATDLLISGNITETYGSLGIAKSGAGTMELSGSNSYTGSTVVNEGTLVLSGTSSSSGSVTVNATGTLSLSSPILNDIAPVVIANGAVMNLNFVGSDTVGSLEIDGSGPLPAGAYNSSHITYGSYFTGDGSLVVAGSNGTWISLVDGNWSDTANWQSGTVAAGYDATATFNAATGSTVTLDTNRIIGNLAFDVSDYILAGTNSLTLNASTVPAISVTAGRTATITAGVGGTVGMEKTGDGLLVLSGVKSYTGGTTVTAGTLEIISTTPDQSAINGTLTVASGANLKISGDDYTGLGRLGARVTTLDVENGTVETAIQCWLTGATVSLNGSSMIGGGTYQIISSGFFSLDSATTSTIATNLLIRKDYGSNDLTIDVGDGTAADDLLITGNIGEVFSSGLNKFGPGKLVLSGTNTYTGNTSVADGALEITSASGLRFRPTANATTNAVSGSITATLAFVGTVDLDLSAADTTNGNVWNLFNLASFSTTPDLSGIAAITSSLGAFSEVAPGVWELPVTGAKWVFTEGDGNLAYVSLANDFDTWRTANAVIGGETDDDDNDGVINRDEYAFGLNPVSGSSLSPITVPLDTTLGTFSYTRRLPSLTGLTYSVWVSTDLSVWNEDTGAAEGTPVVTGEVETVPVTLTNTLLANPSLFIQVRAE